MTRGTALWIPLLLTSLLAAGCSIRKLAIKSLADALASQGTVFASDEDPELVRDALPFALKTIESLLQEAPENRDLLLSACQGFTLYGAGFVEQQADRLEWTAYREAERLYDRALKLYLRARGYCFRALDLAYPGTPAVLARSPGEALGKTRRVDVPLLYWTAGSWGSAISVGLDRPELVADQPAIRALLERALELDPDYRRGALHEALAILEMAQISSGAGSRERAVGHLERAIELSGGERAGTYVTWAEYVALADDDRAEFERLLRLALEVDPEGLESERLGNVILQERARFLLGQVDELFLGDLENLEEPEDDHGLGEAEDPPGSPRP